MLTSCGLKFAILLLLAAVSAAGEDKLQNTNAVLLLAPQGGLAWEDKMHSVAASLAGAYAAADVVFGTDYKALSQAITHIASVHPAKLAVVPVYLCSQDEDLRQAVYMLGLASASVTAYLQDDRSGLEGAVLPRISMPVSLSGALDTDIAVVTALEDKLKPFAPYKTQPMSLLIIGEGAVDDIDNSGQTQALLELARLVQHRQNLYAADVYLLRPDIPDRARQARINARLKKAGQLYEQGTIFPSQKGLNGELQQKVRTLSVQSKVIVLGYSMDDAELERAVSKELNGCFYSWGGTAALSAAEITAWARRRAEAAVNLPDMRQSPAPKKAPR